VKQFDCVAVFLDLKNPYHRFRVVIVICITGPETARLRVRVSLRAEADSRARLANASTRKTVSGRVIQTIFCANFCGYLLNKFKTLF
jgi:hypothetical protein